ncbi:DUF2336 domain-containing protein [Allorhizobium sp. BGMRC 0089]|uniref:DUF2336 domain-containing protein n=1 Tax=Allorhizobium sonneratiae TaxID=2934936 RepID=UPI00203471FE|nr:DUF2336 domain-containing protein [Allorhizobium sonneratiae]MCM2291877.1 DUF2336 domain-containing protein [Allorhizobium sonneratiae]
MATVSSFESLDHPRKDDLKQFAILFQPLFQSSSPEARREAVSALSRSPHVPKSIAFFIACQPAHVAAPFLVASPCLTEDMLITIARTQGKEHAKAIAARENLSPIVIDALAGLRFVTPLAMKREEDGGDLTEAPDRRIPVRATEPSPQKPTPKANTISEKQRLAREESLRQAIKALDRHLHRPDDDRLGLSRITELQTALLVRFAREGHVAGFITALADALGASRFLAERILADPSGRQLATALMGLAMALQDIIFILPRFYPELTEKDQGEPRLARLIASLDGRDCAERLQAWQRADSYTFQHKGPALAKPAAQTG